MVMLMLLPHLFSLSASDRSAHGSMMRIIERSMEWSDIVTVRGHMHAIANHAFQHLHRSYSNCYRTKPAHCCLHPMSMESRDKASLISFHFLYLVTIHSPINKLDVFLLMMSLRHPDHDDPLKDSTLPILYDCGHGVVE